MKSNQNVGKAAGQVVLLTGAAQGIGRATAKRARRAGSGLD